MSRTVISESLRALVHRRAGGFCEYCHLPESGSVLGFEVDHIDAVQHGGKTSAENLALACFSCNRRKGTNIASRDNVTGSLVRLFNPRIDRWNDHFRLDQGKIIPLTAEGRVTAELLQFNSEARVRRRLLVIDGGP